MASASRSRREDLADLSAPPRRPLQQFEARPSRTRACWRARRARRDARLFESARLTPADLAGRRPGNGRAALLVRPLMRAAAARCLCCCTVRPRRRACSRRQRALRRLARQRARMDSGSPRARRRWLGCACCWWKTTSSTSWWRSRCSSAWRAGGAGWRRVSAAPGHFDRAMDRRCRCSTAGLSGAGAPSPCAQERQRWRR